MSKNILKTYVFVILDKSGSMESIKKETVNYFNEQISILKRSQVKNMKSYISLTTFNEEVEHVILNNDILDISSISENTFKPSGMTAMLDAIGSTINKAEEIEDINDENTSCLFIILSDGQENSSKNFTTSDVADKIKKLQATGRWTFTYIGANQDVSLASKQLNIPKGNVLKYESNPLGLSNMTDKQNKYLSSYFMARSYGTKSTKGFYGSDME